MKKSISILVAAHKEYSFPNDSGYRPIQVGKAISNNQLDIEGDNQGENISHLNKSYCEITGLYWMWKNVSANAYGLSHYRRYFSAEGKATQIGKHRVASSRSLEELLENYDAILSRPRNYWIESVQKHYMNAHIASDLKVIENIISRDYPSYTHTYQKIMKGTKISLYNMFIMKEENFKNYCTWLFDVLFKAQEIIPYKTYGPYQGRVFGFLAERLLNIWVRHNIPEHRIKYHQVINLEGESIFGKAVGLLQRKFQGNKQE
ncbi:DUF4422 domain-containing protein [Pseudomonas nitroreducens]|uniref:DUF4422 domain-containing protein n=1 Tax=Pseudomonas nitroreducens TaxID=46680 RepID=UPI00265B5ABC|nr:DUF4422 domain-containing protein [Pseudomonas nitroreducens]MCP1647228.1 hypothetical protein [Pseudomonas nitroreducens]MCP1685804.1 hypothetical protein [Pseudomonas nitroreducens]